MAYPGGSALWRVTVRFAVRAAVIGLCAAAWLGASLSARPVPVNVRWRPAVSAAERAELERRYRLTEARYAEGTTFAYVLTDPSRANIRALIEDSRIEDTANLHRTAFRPPMALYRPWIVGRNAVFAGLAGAVVWLLIPVLWRRARGRARPPGGAASSIAWALAVASTCSLL